MSERYRLIEGDCLEMLKTLPDASVQCCVTSPPYWGLRDYGHDGQLGLEDTPDAYVARMVDVFREVRRVLADDGTLWLNLGDSYASAGGLSQPHRNSNGGVSNSDGGRSQAYAVAGGGFARPNTLISGLKPKDLIGIPWRVAFALQADGWWLRQDIIWHKPNPMPESVTDRCTKTHEYVFLLSKSERYFYNAEAIAERALHSTLGNVERKPATLRGCPRDNVAGNVPWEGSTRNRRSVWSITTKPYSGAHFAVMPPDLAELCIKAGARQGDVVLDPFSGAGTTGLVALNLDCQYIGIELNPEYLELSRRRIERVAAQRTLDFGGANSA